MPRTFHPHDKRQSAPSFHELWQPVESVSIDMPPLEARGNRPLQLNFEHQLKSFVFYHLEEHTSGRHLLQVLEEDDFAREVIAGIKKSSFFEAINSRGLEQLTYVFQQLQAKAAKILPREHAELGNLVAIDGSLIDAVLSMHWADYRNDCKKAKVHPGFDMNQSIPSKLFLAEGKADERPFVSQILRPGQTGVMDQYYPCHKDFDLWQTEEKSFVCRIRENSTKTCIRFNAVKPGGIVFYDAIVLLGAPGVNQTEKQLRVIGYRIDNKISWIATIQTLSRKRRETFPSLDGKD
ncbi:MAG: hypothetical protein AYP45_12175 [Candidatus Brocadia carolinensis]|uniref:Transposase IS4-like domain-containing protein n=1 Tax=Candidatus Brocadia carolinensis TaxID=1004156 RepID=A0A1V4ARY6_9BACT|nr:MAG: hypothetical protein AYP45_12175 [Candidatus Brocadia caroliniensis]